MKKFDVTFKKILALPLLLVLFSLSTSSQGARQKKMSIENEADKRELIRLTREISRASIEGDRAVLERLMDDRFVLVGVSGKTFDKAALIEIWTKKDSSASGSSTPGDFQIFLYDNTAIVLSAITDIERDTNGERTTRTAAFDVWQKTKKGWRWIASRETLLPMPDAVVNAEANSPETVVSELYATLSFSAGQTIERKRVSSLFAPGARLIFAGQNADKSSGETTYSVETFLDFAAAKGQARRREERELWRRVERFGNIADVFSAYELSFDAGEPLKTVRRRGINSAQLIFDGKKWRIVSLIWDIETPNNPLPTQ
jgi:hypothetical protein